MVVEERSADDPTGDPGPGERWSPSDAWLGLLLVATGMLLIIVAVLAVRRGYSWVALLGGTGGFLVGPVLVFIGGNAIVRSLLAARPRSYRDVISSASPGVHAKPPEPGKRLPLSAREPGERSGHPPRA